MNPVLSYELQQALGLVDSEPRQAIDLVHGYLSDIMETHPCAACKGEGKLTWQQRETACRSCKEGTTLRPRALAGDQKLVQQVLDRLEAGNPHTVGNIRSFLGKMMETEDCPECKGKGIYQVEKPGEPIRGPGPWPCAGPGCHGGQQDVRQPVEADRHWLKQQFEALKGQQSQTEQKQMAYRDHQGYMGGGGVQAHSAGEHFPFTLVSQHDPETGEGVIYAQLDDRRRLPGFYFQGGDSPNEAFHTAHQQASESAKQWLAQYGGNPQAGAAHFLHPKYKISPTSFKPRQQTQTGPATPEAGQRAKKFAATAGRPERQG